MKTSVLERQIMNLATTVAFEVENANIFPPVRDKIGTRFGGLVGFDRPHNLQPSHEHSHPENIRLSHPQRNNTCEIQPYKPLR